MLGQVLGILNKFVGMSQPFTGQSFREVGTWVLLNDIHDSHLRPFPPSPLLSALCPSIAKLFTITYTNRLWHILD